MSRAFARVLRYQAPAVVWSAIILIVSSDPFSAQHTGLWLQELIARLFGRHFSGDKFFVFHFAVRKIAHLVEYGICGALMFRAVRRDAPTRWTLRWALLAIALATAVAGIDEWHQTFIPSRTGTLDDVALDAAGAVAAQLLIRLVQMLF